MKVLSLATLLVGCSSDALIVQPTSVDWGDVNFNEIRPTDGYDPRQITLRNDGNKALDITILSFDEAHLLLGAQLITDAPPALAPLEPGTQVVITAAVWDYDIDAGERDTLVTGSFSLDAAGLRDPVAVDWSFTPVRIFD